MADSDRRIEALEAELARLRDVLSRPGATAQPEAPPPLSAAVSSPYSEAQPLPSFYWLEKLAMALTVVVFVAGFFLLVHRAPGPLIHAGGGILSLLLLAWGLCQAAPGRLMSQGVLACGMGTAFISALDLLDVFPSPWPSLGVLCVVTVLAVAARWRQSEAAFGVVAVLACVCAIPDLGLYGTGGLGITLTLCLCVFLITGPRAGTFPIWAACAAVFAQLALPMVLMVPSGSPARNLAAMLLLQSLTTLTCLRYVVRGGPRPYNAALLVFGNAVICVVVVSWALDGSPAGVHALGMALSAVLFALLAGTSHRWRPTANPIMACLSTVVMIAAAMGMWSGLPEELFAPALAAGSAMLVVVCRQTGSPLLRRLEAVSAMAAFGFCLFRLQLGGLVSLGAITLPANWLNAFGTMFFLCLAATLHEKCFPGGLCRGTHHTKAMARAALAALILLTITVLDRGADTALPFVLAAESLGVVGLGLLLFTPQIGVAGMFLLAPAHLCYHAFLWQPLPGFTTQPDFTLNTAGMVAFTLAGAATWERYLRRFHSSTAEWDHYAVVALPFLAAAFLSYTLLCDWLPVSVIPAGMAALGVLCLAPSRLLRLDGLTMAALFCLGAAGMTYGLLVYPPLSAASTDSLFVPGTTLMILLFVTAERLTARLFPGTVDAPHRLADAVRLLLCAAAVAAACAGICAASQGATLGRGLTGASVLFVCLGWTCGMRAYSYLAVFVLLSVPALSFAGIRHMAPGLETVVALGIAGAVAAARLRIGSRRRFQGGTDEIG